MSQNGMHELKKAIQQIKRDARPQQVFFWKKSDLSKSNFHLPPSSLIGRNLFLGFSTRKSPELSSLPQFFPDLASLIGAGRADC